MSDVTTVDANCANAYVRVRTWNFSDGCGNTSANFVQTITVIDNTVPVVSTSTGSLNHNLQCNNTAGIASALAETPSATDNCTVTPTKNLVSDVTTADANCTNAYVRVRTWNFSDGCGNTSANFVQTITVIDNTVPVVSTSTGSLNHILQCNNTAGIASALAETPLATDNCTVSPTKNLVSDVTTADANCTNAYVRVRTWNFSDGCGNTSANFVQTITVIDNTVPVVNTSTASLNHTLQCNNTAGIASALAETPLATDNCTVSPTKNLVSDVTTADTNCTNAYVRVRTWNFSDGCGNTSANFVQTITVIDNTVPVVSTSTGSLNHTLQCNNTAGIASALAETPLATDNCTVSPTKNLVSDVTTADANCANAYVRVRTWNFSDGCGNTSANFVQTITVIDNTVPVVSTSTGSLNHTLQCNNTAGIASALVETPSATDNCTVSPTKNLVSDVTTVDPNCANAYVRVRIWNFSDGCGNTSANFVQTITVIDNTAPAVSTSTGSLNHTLQCNNTAGIASALAETPSATDNCTVTPTKNLVSDVTTADANCANAYVRVRNWNFSDGCGNTSANFVQTITVIDSTPPTFNESLPSNMTVECNAIPPVKTLTANDNCGIATVSFSETETPGNCPGSSTILRTWTATDACLNKTSYTQTIKVQDTTPPTFTPPANITLTSDENCFADTTTALTGTVTNIQDNCDSNPTATFVDHDCFGNSEDTSINTGSGNYFPFTVSGFDDITASNIEKLALAFEANQGKGRVEFTLVSPSGQGIVLVAPYCAGGNCDTASPSNPELYLPVFYPNGSTYPKWNNNNPIQTDVIQNFTPYGALSSTNTIIGLSSYVSSFEELTGSMNGNWFIYARKDGTAIGTIYFKSVCLTPVGLCKNNKVIVRHWSVSDACKNTVGFDQVIKIIDTTAPTWTTQATALNTTIECSNTEALAAAQLVFPIAKDNCDLDVSNITKVSGQFMPSQGCANAGTYTNTWTVKDECGNTSEVFTQVITIEDTTAPTWSTQTTALNRTVECSDAEALATAQGLIPTATDKCDADVTNITKVSGQFMPSQGCANAGTYTNTWTIKDDCGNTSELFTQVITIEDTTAPTWSTQAITLNKIVECSDAEALATAQGLIPTATDKCDADVTNITKVSGQFMASEGCVNAGTYTNTWTVKDNCGNTSEVFTQVITIEDTTTPTWSTQPTTLNTTIECSNTEALAAAQGLIPTATDKCDADVTNITKVSGQFMASEGCANAGTYTNTWTVKDECGNTSELFTQVITIEDTTAPIWSTQASALNKTVECSDAEALATAQGLIPTATDKCDMDVSNITKVSGQFMASEGCANAGTYTNTWTVKDNCGNSSEMFTQVITIEDTTAPTWSTQASALNKTVECSDAEALAIAQGLIPTATDKCDADVTNITKVSGQFMASEGCANAGTYTNTWTVKDECGNTSEMFTQVITIEDTTAPTWSTQASALNRTVECSDAEALATAQGLIPTATDKCDMDVSNITKVSGQFIASEGCANAGTYTNTWTVKDGCGNTSEVFTQVITIEDTTAPTWSTQASVLNKTVECSDAEALAIAQGLIPTATDKCDADVANITKVSGQFMASEGCTNAGTYTNTWTVKDECGNTSEMFTQVITIEDTTAPTWSTQASALNRTVECSDAEALATVQGLIPTATDKCDADVANITKVSGQFIASEGCANAGTYTNTWTVKDGCGNTSEVFTQVITIEDTTAPIINVAASNITVECDGQGNQNFIADWLAKNGGASASDNCSDVTWSNNFNALANDCSTAVTVKFTAKDACGNISSTSATFSVKDSTAPVAPLAPATITVACASDVPAMASLTATDNCNGQITTQGIDTIVQGECINSYVINRTWTFTDACSNSSSTSQIINVIDNTAPMIRTLPEVSTITCPETPNFITATATDNCGSDVKLTFSDVTTNGACAGSYSVTRTWTATDACGNASTASQTINVQDTTAPVIAALPEASTITCPAMPVFAQAIATDGCGSNVSLAFEDKTTNGQCAGSYSVTRTWKATDACGNAATATQTINVQDITAPIIAPLPEASTISCPAAPAFSQAIATDGCGSTVTLAFEDKTTNGQCAGSYSITRTWTATDTCGNAAMASQTINVQDTTAPVIAALPEASTISCPAAPVFATATAIDNCGSIVTLAFEDKTTNGTCVGSYSVTRTWTATDTCGNASTATQTINIQDTTAPVIAALPPASTISCPTTPVFASATATDNCGSIVTLAFEDKTTNSTCTSSYSVTRTWTATDACGNAATASQTINVQDTTGPTTASVFSPSIDVNCNAIPAKPELVFADNCSAVSPAVFTENIINRTQNSYSIIREWNVADVCGNTSKFVQIVNVTVANGGLTIASSACNADSSTIDLNSLLPQGTSTNGTWTWTNTVNASALQGSIFSPLDIPVGDYVFEYKINGVDCPLSMVVNMNVNFDCKVLGCGTILVHNAFSPNGDGINENFIIDNIDDSICYPDNTVEIYNRWGVLVFETTGYNNTSKVFKGISEGRTTISQSSGLPTGTYYYILNYTSFDNSGKTLTNKKDGFLYLTKN
ncbi:gliding motility-associated C-terminal domain-containing protein [Flavobacterium sp. LB1P62]|uniref:gliding motility-associated C-terminal domain-containing protein n=1 Tax=Flavobacterium sp. LB1P62 TaxID=3401715 RepID=UPI003AAB6516